MRRRWRVRWSNRTKSGNRRHLDVCEAGIRRPRFLLPVNHFGSITARLFLRLDRSASLRQRVTQQVLYLTVDTAQFLRGERLEFGPEFGVDPKQK